MRPLFTVSAIAITIFAGCSTQVGSDAAFQRDSFQNPTHHGALSFSELNGASLTNNQRFHAWSFELVGDGRVALETMSLTTNVDTVMYLYKADAEGNKTGAYLKKNDDHDDELASLIETELEAGTYAVVVKAHKTQIRGSFDLRATCEGEGCPAPPVPLTFDEQCELVDDGVADCVFDGWTVEECAPTDSHLALQCCNAIGDTYCDATCEAGVQWLDADLDFVYDDLNDDENSSVRDVAGHVWPVCAGTTFDDVIADAKGAYSELLEQYAQPGWEDGQKVSCNQVDNGIMWSAGWVLDELDTIAHSDACEAWVSTVEVPCPNCTNYVEKWVIFYPATGTSFVFEGEWGYDS